LIAGTPSHAKGDHEFNAGVQLLHKALEKQTNVLTTFYLNGWPKDPTAFDNADSIVFYMNGGDGHAAIQGDHLQQLEPLMKKGVGFVNLHYAVEVPKEKGGAEWLRWMGGYFETFYSVNPTWEADFAKLPNHPITRGVQPFKIRDEWYYNMRFADKGVMPILTAIPPDNTRQGKDDAHGGNEFVRSNKGRPEHVGWAFERPDGGRGFGFTGGHYHKNWGNENFRKLVLNALLWTAKAEVPQDGVQSTITEEDLAKNWDEKK
jgi:type 1 glutamine amidotransferase